jgi:DNA-binding ferritin-like protein
MSLMERIAELKRIGNQIKKSAFLEKGKLVEELAEEMIEAISELSERIEKLEGANNG